MTVSPETTFGRYKILSAIGAGGMGEVFLAQDTRLRRKVALKILPEKFMIDSDRLNRFEQEAKAASALNHPNEFCLCLQLAGGAV
jgi:serine/threonine protein kinase